MPSAELLLAFAAATAVFAFIPGPAMLYAAAQTVARGRWSGLMASFGIHLGAYVHVFAAAAGLSVLFQAVPVLYLAVKLAGAAYLIWLGVGMFRAQAPRTIAAPSNAMQTGRRAFFESVTVEVLNPKTALFFLAFLPQFIDGAAEFPVWVQFLVLGTIVNTMFTFADLTCVALAGALMSRLRRSTTTQIVMQRAGGSLLIGLGVHLALQKS